MDQTLQSICTFLRDVRYEDLGEDVVLVAKRLLIDSLGCAVGGHATEQARMAREVATAVTPSSGASSSVVWVDGTQTSPDLAAFANGVAMRVLDFNDYFHAMNTGGHPSDYIAAVLAVAEDADADGKQVLLSIVSAYEIFCRYMEVGGLGSGAWDQIVPGVLASAGASAQLMGLTGEQTAHAVSLAIVANMALQETRLGNVSIWKGAAAANASRNGIFAATLARVGITGPDEPFSGRGGVFAEAVKPFEAPSLGANNTFAITRCQFKRFPVGSLSQSAATATAELRSQISDIADVAEIEVLTNHEAIRIMAADQEKWHPETRESADHSIPYVVAVTLIKGAPTVADFEEELFREDYVLDLMSKVKVAADDECVAAFPATTMAKVRIKLTDGTNLKASATYHRGHPNNPMTDDELEHKFRQLVVPVLGAGAADDILDIAWTVDDQPSIGRLIKSLQRPGV
jgi:2-methylcitrate dehydratase